MAFDIILGMAFLKDNLVIVDAEENMMYYKPIVKNEVFTNFSIQISPFTRVVASVHSKKE